ncbi:hypothetical protein BTUL_0337g00010 [Botrytis tulipae]|uniref:Carrier domain-containing protein n=1 Tax=Botrytis tulipae TaxID=87230 RepID=A0A4Z1E8Z2_9HELO|nr:hypothetical protein BTUL_0337g00010 [Botrytis tulipae]
MNIDTHRLVDHVNSGFWGNFVDDPKVLIIDSSGVRMRSHFMGTWKKGFLEVSIATTPELVAAAITTFGATAQSNRTPKMLKVLHDLTDNLCDEISLEPILEEIGIDSLLVTKGFNKTQFSFGLEIALYTFLSLQTVKAICRHIDFALGAILGAPSEAPTPTEAKMSYAS